MTGPSSALAISRDREYVCVSRNKGAAVVIGYPTTHSKAYEEMLQRKRDAPDARVAVYLLRHVEWLPPLPRDEDHSGAVA